MSVQAVARKAGLSVASVSRVINRHPLVAPETRERVEAAMRELGYVPPDPARRRGPRTEAHRGVRTRSIAVIFAEPAVSLGSSPLHATLLHGIEAALTRRNLNLILCQLDGTTPLPPAIRRGAVDGILFEGRIPTGDVADRLRRFPGVWMLTRHGQEWWGDSVEPDNSAAGELAARHLLDRGHTHVAFLNLEPDMVPFVQRGDAFVATMSRAGGTVDKVAANPSPRTARPLSYPEQVDAAVDRLLRGPSRPTAVFIPFDMVTDAVFRALASRGILPGRDIEIVSCDNGWLGLTGLRPRPAAVDLRIEAIGAQAVEHLLWRMANPYAPVGMRILVPPLLVPAEPAATATGSHPGTRGKGT